MHPGRPRPMAWTPVQHSLAAQYGLRRQADSGSTRWVVAAGSASAGPSRSTRLAPIARRSRARTRELQQFEPLGLITVWCWSRTRDSIAEYYASTRASFLFVYGLSADSSSHRTHAMCMHYVSILLCESPPRHMQSKDLHQVGRLADSMVVAIARKIS